MADPDFMKEYLRDAFMNGALDLGRDRKYLEGFVRMFAGEMEAIIAVEQAAYLEDTEQIELLKIARPSRESADHYRAWNARILRPARKP